MMEERPTSPLTRESSVNTTLHLSNGPSLRRTPSSRPRSATSPEGNLLGSNHYNLHPISKLTIVKDNRGYGMKISGDNPVYVQSVKEGGPAERAGLHSGDKIIKVNGTDVTHSTHVQVVDLIKSCVDEVELTVQKRTVSNSRPPAPTSLSSTNCSPNNRSPSPMPPTTTTCSTPTRTTMPNLQRPLHHHHSAPARDRITGPQPVDHEKRRQLECQRLETFRLMVEKEQRYIEALRSELVKCTDPQSEKQISRDLIGAERRLKTLQDQLQGNTSNSNCSTLPSSPNNGLIDVQLPTTPPPPPPLSTLPSRMGAHSTPLSSNVSSANVSDSNLESPPPLPSRNPRTVTSPVLGLSPTTTSPPPLPPRQYLHSNSNNVDGCQDSVVCTDLSSPTSPVPVHHQRTKSNPDRVNSMANAAKRLLNAESLGDLSSMKRSKGGVSWSVESPLTSTPPGTPPPPYHGTPQHRQDSNNSSSVPSPPIPPPPPDEFDESNRRDSSSFRLDSSSPNGSSLLQNTIISMEDDDMSDQETSQLEEQGPFKSISKLLDHNAHLAVFLNYVISNSDPSSILFYLVTELYKEGNGKEMRKWAYEIQSSFLGPGAPLKLKNVDDNIARDIDNILVHESDKEEMLKKIFWKARAKAKDELNEQLADFQQKRIAGLATLYGPNDEGLKECYQDKSKELKVIADYLVPKLEPYVEELDKEKVDDEKFTIAAALSTIISKFFGFRGQHFNTMLDRCPTFVSKDKSLFKARFIGKGRKKVNVARVRSTSAKRKRKTQTSENTTAAKLKDGSKFFGNTAISRKNCVMSRKYRIFGVDRMRKMKVTVRGHQFIAHQYFTVTYCNHCQNIIRGIGPQGYQCSSEYCNLNIHRPCAKVLEETCPGPAMKKDRGNDKLRNFMDKIRPERNDPRRKPNRDSIYDYVERIRRQGEDREEGSSTDNDLGEKSSSSSKSNKSNNAGSNLVDSFKETDEKQTSKQFIDSENTNFLRDITPPSHHLSQRCKAGTSINRSESYKERIHPKRQVRERRKTSDPNLSKTNTDVEVDNNSQFPYPSTNSGSSSNSNLSSRSLDSPSNSLEVVGSSNKGSCENTSVTVPNTCSSSTGSLISCPVSRITAWDSDTEAEPDPPDWTKCVPPDVLRNLTSSEKKRQEVINELFHTERSHVRALKILDQLFYQPMRELQIIPPEQLQLLFANLDEMLEIHSQFNNNMKLKKKENSIVGDIGDILLKMFDGAEGEIFEDAAATFCSRQQIALEALKERRRKDPNLQKFLNDAECNPICRRLQLKDIIPTGMLRLTKYPLLFENLAKHTKNNPEEEKCVQRALERSKEILNRVNEAVKDAEDQHKLAEIQRKLIVDKTNFDKDIPVANEFRNLDLTKHKLIHEGVLKWMIDNTRPDKKPKLVDLYVLLLQDIIVLLQKSDEKYILKFFNMNSKIKESSPAFWCPVIKVSEVLVKTQAREKVLYLVNQPEGEPQWYTLLASSLSERDTWFNRISEAADAYSKAKENKHKSRSSDVSNVPLHDLDSEIDQVNQFAKTKENEHGGVSDTANLPPSINAPSSQDDSGHGNDAAARKSGTSGGGISPGQRRKGAVNAERKRLPENLLIEPSQVSVFERTVHTAEAVLTPLERLRRKDELIREALQEKQKLVADILHVPKDEFETISDLATEPAFNKEASELVLAAVNQADQLTSILNECLRVTEEDTVAASAEVLVSSSTSSSTATTAAGGGKSPTRTFPPLPVPKIQSISSVLSANLTQLFAVITNHEEEREKWRQELQKYREEVHRMHELQQLQQQRVDEQNSAASSATTPAPAPAPATVAEGDVSSSVTSSAATTEDHNKSPITTTSSATGDSSAAAANGADSVQNEKK
ncbi:rho guanine nucleotide exchange factor 12 isoform X3 [Planococcus citri]|uniref:rho guanine nucleotide exchange factor 12 isoform X3 n=1 Tax=Planococcus citri TaxID=170843 RepID=UPI0031F92A38